MLCYSLSTCNGLCLCFNYTTIRDWLMVFSCHVIGGWLVVLLLIHCLWELWDYVIYGSFAILFGSIDICIKWRCSLWRYHVAYTSYVIYQMETLFELYCTLDWVHYLINISSYFWLRHNIFMIMVIYFFNHIFGSPAIELLFHYYFHTLGLL